MCKSNLILVDQIKCNLTFKKLDFEIWCVEVHLNTKKCFFLLYAIFKNLKVVVKYK